MCAAALRHRNLGVDRLLVLPEGIGGFPASRLAVVATVSDLIHGVVSGLQNSTSRYVRCKAPARTAAARATSASVSISAKQVSSMARTQSGTSRILSIVIPMSLPQKMLCRTRAISGPWGDSVTIDLPGNATCIVRVRFR